MPSTILAVFAELSRTSWSMSFAILALFGVGLWAARRDFASGRGIDRVVALAHMCYAIPLAAFGAEHLGSPNALLPLVPKYMPVRMFWVYFVGLALIAASLSIATKIRVQWSGFLVGVMMFLFVAMLYIPGGIRVGGRNVWTIVFRETSFGAGGWVLAGLAMGGIGDRRGRNFIVIGRTLIALTAIFFGIEHFLHPLGIPGVPLQKQTPDWVPLRAFIDYLMGAGLLVAAMCFLLGQRVRMAAAYLGTWIVFLVAVIYGPVLIAALGSPSPAVQVEGLNYFADTLLFGGVILSVARAMPAVAGMQQPERTAASSQSH